MLPDVAEETFPNRCYRRDVAEETLSKRRCRRDVANALSNHVSMYIHNLGMSITILIWTHAMNNFTESVVGPRPLNNAWTCHDNFVGTLWHTHTRKRKEHSTATLMSAVRINCQLRRPSFPQPAYKFCGIVLHTSSQLPVPSAIA